MYQKGIQQGDAGLRRGDRRHPRDRGQWSSPGCPTFRAGEGVTMATSVVAPQAASRADTGQPVPRRSAGRVVGMFALVDRRRRVPLPVLLHLVIGSLQREPQTDPRRRVPEPGESHARQLLRHQRAGGPRPAHSSTPVSSRAASCYPTLVLRAAGRLRAGTAQFPRAHRALHGDAADPGPAVPALHDPALRAHRAHVRPVGQLPRDDPAVRDQRDRRVHLPPVLHPIAPGTIRIRSGSTARPSSSSSAGSRSRWLGPRSSRR